MSDMLVLAHRVIGRVNISAPEEQEELIPVSRILIRNLDKTWIITECLGYDGEITHEDKQAILELGDHFTEWSGVVERYNADDFDSSDWDAPECVCGECNKGN